MTDIPGPSEVTPAETDPSSRGLMASAVEAPAAGARQRRRWKRPSWWLEKGKFIELLVGNVILALLVGLVLVWVTNRSDDRRRIQQDRVENLRFVRSVAGGPAPSKQLQSLDLRGVTMNGLDLSGARLTGADLRDTLDFDVDFTGADLHDTDLRNAYLGGSRLVGANLKNAALDFAGLNNVDVLGADLTDATLYGALFQTICFDATTKWPFDYKVPTNNLKCPQTP